MTDRGDGPWDSATEHDDQHDADLSGEDPPTVRASETQRAKARAASVATNLVNQNVVAKPPSNTLPPPTAQRKPAAAAARTSTGSDIVMLDKVSGNMPIDHAPRRGESAAGGVVVVATGNDAERVRKLCHKHGLLVPVMTSLAVVHDAMSIIVIGEPSPPAAERVVHVARPTLPDDALLDLLRSLVNGRVVVDPPPATGVKDARVSEAALQVAAFTDRAAIELSTVDSVIALTGADRAHCLFHDPQTGALWSEAKKRGIGDDRKAMSGIVGFAAHTGHAVYASPAGDDPRWLQEIDDPEGKPQSRVLVQPLIAADRRVHAVLVAVRRWRNTDFTDAERKALAGFATLAGAALDLASVGPQLTRRATRPGIAPLTSAALPALPRATSDSRPPPVTTRASVTAPPTGPIKRPAEHIVPVVDDATKVDERYSSESILSLPSPPTAPAPQSQRATGPVAAIADRRTGPVRTKSDSSQPRPRRDGDQRDLAVVANDVDAKRVQRLASKHRLELSTFPKLADAPEFYQVITIGEAFGGDDARVAYAARSTITDDQLGDLLAAVAHDRVVTPAAPLVKPQSAAEARRSQIAFAGARKLAALTDLAEAEALISATLHDLLDTDRAYVCLVDPTTGALWSETRKRAGGDDRHAIAGISGWVARTGRAVNVSRASADPRWLGPLDDPDGDPNSQLLMQPLVRADEHVHGVLIAARRARRPGFTDTDAALLARFAALAAPLLEQIAVAAEAQQMIGEDTSSRSPVPAATGSSLQELLTGSAARWIFLALGLIVGLLIGLLL